MPRNRELLQSCSRALVIVLGSLLAHLIAGGSLISLWHFSLYGSAVLFLFIFFKLDKFEGPQLALAVTLSQSFGHFVLGGADRSNLLMLASHFIAGFITFHMFAHAEKAWEFLDFLRALFEVKVYIATPKFEPILFRIIPIHLVTKFFCYSCETDLERGPPCLGKF